MRWPDECGGLDQRHNFLSEEIAERDFFSGAVSSLLNSFHYADQLLDERERKWMSPAGINKNIIDDTDKKKKKKTLRGGGQKNDECDFISHLHSKCSPCSGCCSDKICADPWPVDKWRAHAPVTNLSCVKVTLCASAPCVLIPICTCRAMNGRWWKRKQTELSSNFVQTFAEYLWGESESQLVVITPYLLNLKILFVIWPFPLH